MGAVTCITSGKGGVGKSSLCAGLGAALTKRGRRVLLIDGDAGLPALDVFLSCAEERVYDIADVIAGRASIKDALYSCPWAEGLWLLPAPSREEDCISPLLMKQVTDLLIPYYDHILIDCPAGLGTGFQSASSAAQRALVVATPDPVCIRASAKTRLELEAAGISQQRLGYQSLSSGKLPISEGIPRFGRCDRLRRDPIDRCYSGGWGVAFL